MENTATQTKYGVESIKYTDLSELELAYKVVQYDSKALEELYNRYSPLLYSLINGITYKNDANEEILSEVFSLIWRKIDHFDFSTGNFYTWIVTLTRNKAVDYLTKNRNEDPGYKSISDIYEDFYMIPILSPKIDVLDINSALSLNEEVDKAISELTDTQKYIIHLIYYEGYTISSISKKLNISQQTAIEKIRSAFDSFAVHFFPAGFNLVPPEDDRIYIYSSGCMDTDDYPDFINNIHSLPDELKETFGIYQILSSLIPVIIDIKNPGNEVKNMVAKKLFVISKEGKLKRTKTISDLPPLEDVQGKKSFHDKYFYGRTVPPENYEHEETKEEYVHHEEVSREEIPPKEVHYDNRPVLVERSIEDYEAFQKEKLTLLKNAVKKDFKKILILDFFLVIIISALIGGAVYYFLNERIRNDQTYISNLNGKIDNLNEEIIQLNVDQKIFTLQNSKDTKLYSLDGTPANSMGFGRLKISANGKEALLQLFNMPELPEEKIYQLWLISKGQPFSLGTFRTTRSSEDFLVSELPEVEEKNMDSFLLTAEDENGSSFPSNEIYLSRNLK